jgi:maleylacetoacetate isomerase
MRLFDYFRSSASYRVRIALNLKGIAYERVPVSLINDEHKEAEHRARNPQGFVPALETDDGTMLTQSYAILEWLDARYPEPRLFPTDPDVRAHAVAQAMIVGMDIHPLNNLRVLRRLKHQIGVTDEQHDAWYAHWVTEGFAALEAMAGDGPFLGGDAPNIADLFLVPQMFNARRFDVPVDDFPKLIRADAAAQDMPAFADAHPERVAPEQ